MHKHAPTDSTPLFAELVACKKQRVEMEPKKDGDSVFIYYGSQSGTAETFANELTEDAIKYKIKATAVDMEDFKPEKFVNHKVVVLVVATYGEGDPTDNAVEFFKWIQDESLGPDTLKGMHFTVMGLGNRQYVHFNATGRIADERMAHLGATRIYERGEGDDDQNIQGDFEQWRENGFWPALIKANGGDDMAAQEIGLDGGIESRESQLFKLGLRVEIFSQDEDPPIDPMVKMGGGDVLSKWYFNSSYANVTRCEELRQIADEHAGKTTKHLDFDVKSFPALDWRTADNLEVLPCNPDHLIHWFAECIGVSGQLDNNVAFICTHTEINNEVKKLFPTPCTVRDALGFFCDLNKIPTRAIMWKFASFVKDQEDQNALKKLLEDNESFGWLAGEQIQISFQEFFELFLSSTNMDFSTFVQLCPRQKSRPYTIASSWREDKNTIGICVSAIQKELPSLNRVIEDLAARGHNLPRAKQCLKRLHDAGNTPRRFRGLCSTMLCTQISAGDRLWISVRASSFQLPRNVNTPILMIGAGTGIAPFRAFVREFRAEKGIRTKTLLFFGCTQRDSDFLYRQELQEALRSEPPALGEIIAAFSREQPEKIYVQHRFREQAKKVADLIMKGAYVYICGNFLMGAAIRKELSSTLGSPDCVSQLQAEGRLVEELW